MFLICDKKDFENFLILSMIVSFALTLLSQCPEAVVRGVPHPTPPAHPLPPPLIFLLRLFYYLFCRRGNNESGLNFKRDFGDILQTENITTLH